MTSFALLFTLSAIGISETAYLIRKRIAAERPFCLLNEDCTTVLSSKYNKIFLIPNDMLGLLFYITLAAITALIVIDVEPISLWRSIAYLSTAAASVASLFFIFLQWRVIKAWCFWCIMSACTIFLMGAIILISKI